MLQTLIRPAAYSMNKVPCYCSTAAVQPALAHAQSRTCSLGFAWSMQRFHHKGFDGALTTGFSTGMQVADLDFQMSSGSCNTATW